ncbi:MAG: hypothetical protein WBS17_01785 [Candidatus Acidiferrales bacterium]
MTGGTIIAAKGFQPKPNCWSAAGEQGGVQWVAKNMMGDSQIVIRAARAAREFCQKMCD